MSTEGGNSAPHTSSGARMSAQELLSPLLGAEFDRYYSNVRPAVSNSACELCLVDVDPSSSSLLRTV